MLYVKYKIEHRAWCKNTHTHTPEISPMRFRHVKIICNNITNVNKGACPALVEINGGFVWFGLLLLLLDDVYPYPWNECDMHTYTKYARSKCVAGAFGLFGVRHGSIHTCLKSIVKIEKRQIFGVCVYTFRNVLCNLLWWRANVKIATEWNEIKEPSPSPSQILIDFAISQFHNWSN